MLEKVKTAVSGQECPKSGLWIPDGHGKKSMEFKEGDVFPKIDGRRTRWKFLLHLLN